MEPSESGSLDEHKDVLNVGEQSQVVESQGEMLSESNNVDLNEPTASSTGEVKPQVELTEAEKSGDDDDSIKDDADGKVSSKMKHKKDKEAVPVQPEAEPEGKPKAATSTESKVSTAKETSQPETAEIKSEIVEKLAKTVEPETETIEKDSESGDSQEDFVKVDSKEIEEANKAQRESEELLKTSETSEEKQTEGQIEETPGFVDVLGNGTLTKKVSD